VLSDFLNDSFIFFFVTILFSRFTSSFVLLLLVLKLCHEHVNYCDVNGIDEIETLFSHCFIVDLFLPIRFFIYLFSLTVKLDLV